MVLYCDCGGDCTNLYIVLKCIDLGCPWAAGAYLGCRWGFVIHFLGAKGLLDWGQGGQQPSETAAQRCFCQLAPLKTKLRIGKKYRNFTWQNLWIFKRYHTLHHHHHHHHGCYCLLWTSPVKCKRKDTQDPQWRVFQSRAGKKVCQFWSSMISYQFHAVWLTESWCSGWVSGLSLWGGRAEFRTLVHQRPPGPT